MNYFIITGTSRGIGEAIARKLLKPDNTLFCISRRLNEDLAETALGLHVPLYYTEGDVSDPSTVENFMKDTFQRVDTDLVQNLALINNAGMLDPVGPIENLSYESMLQHARVNYLAPAHFISLFLRLSKEIKAGKTILNISSGASRFPYDGWTMYCSSKAAVDMITRVSALEQGENGTKILALAPGIVETQMQEKIRQVDPDIFKSKEKFVRLYEEGKLLQPELVAQTVVDAFLNPAIPQGSVLSLDELKSYTTPA